MTAEHLPQFRRRVPRCDTAGATGPEVAFVVDRHECHLSVVRTRGLVVTTGPRRDCSGTSGIGETRRQSAITRRDRLAPGNDRTSAVEADDGYRPTRGRG